MGNEKGFEGYIRPHSMTTLSRYSCNLTASIVALTKIHDGEVICFLSLQCCNAPLECEFLDLRDLLGRSIHRSVLPAALESGEKYPVSRLIKGRLLLGFSLVSSCLVSLPSHFAF